MSTQRHPQDAIDSKALFQMHKESWCDCEQCPLHEFASRKVFYRGRIPCDILFLGEAPGTVEDVTGAPFTGPAGKLLDEWISEAQDVTDFTYGIANTVACLPLVERGGKTRPPTPHEIHACYPRLNELVRIVQPIVLITLGKTAGLYPPDGDFPRLELMHPAAVLRSGSRAQDKRQRLKLKHFLQIP